jgi:PAS domain S-box-containing protein
MQDPWVSRLAECEHWNIPGVGTYSWDILRDRVEWSPGLAAIYGLPSAPTEEAGFTRRVHPDDRVRVEAETTTFLQHGTSYEHEFRIIRPDGEIRVIHDRGVIDRATDGTAVAMRGMNIDMTRQRRPQGRSDAPEDLERFRRLVDNIDQLAWMTDESGFIYWYNQRWYDYTGTTPAAMRGWGWTAVHHPDHVDRVVAGFRASIASGQPWEDTFPLRSRDGSYRWFLSRTQPVRGADGRISHWYGTNTDVTDRREGEERLRQSDDRFKRMADSVPQLVWCAAADGRVVYYNRQLARFAPIVDTGTGGFDWSDLIHPDDLADTRACWSEAVASGEEYSCEHRLVLADGTWRWHLSRANPAPGDDGGEATWYGTSTDIHDLKRLESQRILLLQEVDHRMKNTLSLVQSIANQTFRVAGGDRTAVDAFNARLRALAKANDILVEGEWAEADMEAICRRTLAALGVEDRVSLSGPALKVAARVGFVLSLGMHELATNAMKHGSLTRPGGEVSVTWDDGRDGSFRLVWEERNGPPVVAPQRQGFGSRLLKHALATEIHGRVVIAYAAAGLRCDVTGRLE